MTYAPGSVHATGEMAAETYTPNSTHLLADCDYVFDGYEFKGWMPDGSDAILPAGMEYEFATDTTLTATWRSSWTDLQAAIDEAGNGEEIQLEEDAIASPYDSALVIPAGKGIILDLNGYTLSREINTAVADGHVLTNNGTLIIMDSAGGSGNISGGFNSTQSQGGAVINNGTLTLESGAITGNQGYMAGAVLNGENAFFIMTGRELTGNISGVGGGCAVVNYGTMPLSGGSITDNVSEQNGGGIWNQATLNLNGGTISSNAAGDMGGGIFAHPRGTLRISGAPAVTENSSTERGANNLHCGDEGGTLAAIRAVAPADGLRIGLSSSVLPTEKVPVTLSTGVSSASGFFSDSENDVLVEKGGALKLIVVPAFGSVDFILPGSITDIGDSAFEGANMTVAYVPDGCASIGAGAFRNCVNLTRIRIPADCSISTDTFEGCGTVYVFGASGSDAEAFCDDRDYCLFVAE